MCYPTLEEVKHAGYDQLMEWYQHLPSPGHYVQGSAGHDTVQASQQAVLDLIIRKLNAILTRRTK